MESKKICPMCNGKKLVKGQCECDMEWRSSDGENNLEDCKCEPDQECPACKGTGFIDE